MKRLPVDLLELAALLDQPRGGPVRAFFDRATGELESMPRDAEVEGVFDDIVSQPERWVEIQPVPLADRRELRRRFVDEEMTDPHLRLRLFEVLEGERSFTRFESVLRERRELRAGLGAELIDRWLAFREKRLAPLALAWLSALDVDPLARDRDPS